MTYYHFRGENGPTCYTLSPVEGNPEKCLFKWLLDTDIKVKYQITVLYFWIPDIFVINLSLRFISPFKRFYSIFQGYILFI